MSVLESVQMYTVYDDHTRPSSAQTTAQSNIASTIDYTGRKLTMVTSHHTTGSESTIISSSFS